MKNILNLVSKENSEINYRLDKFPDGQSQITLIDIPQEPVYIKSRLNNFIDLEKIICTVKSLREMDINEIHLFCPYFSGSRSDRKFEIGSNNYLRDVICPIVNSLNLQTVTCLDAHSYVLEACINNYRHGDMRFFYAYCRNQLPKDYFIICPDAGAQKRTEGAAGQMRYNGEIITCSKERDKEGNLTKCNVPLKPEHIGKDLVIIDDICDGGKTFINIAEQIFEKKKFLSETEKLTGNVYLIVTHGIFSKGFNELNTYFDGVFTTNSYNDLTINGISFPGSEKTKQFNLF